MDTLLGWLGIAFLVLLGPVVLVFAAWYAKKRGWTHDFRSLLAALLIHYRTGSGSGVYWPGLVPDDHGQDAERVLLGDGE